MSVKEEKIRIARRSITFIVRTILIVAVIACVMLYAFFQAMNMSNLYILATDGMRERADAMLLDDADVELEEFFLKSCISDDARMHETAQKYEAYFIRGYEYKLTIESISVAPWSSAASMKIIERVTSIDGELPSDSWPEGTTEESDIIEPPAWEDSEYELKFKRDESGRWFISEVKYIGQAPAQKAKFTPAPFATETPA